MTHDHSIRLAAFDWLKQQSILHDDVFPRDLLEKGFHYQGERIALLGAQGIWKPRQMQLPISITTVSDGPYNDSFTKDGFLTYKYRGTDPYHRDNVGLRTAMQQGIPLIYFHSLIRGKYIAAWPVFIQADNMQDLSFTVAVDDMEYLKDSLTMGMAEKNLVREDEPDLSRRAYITTSVRTRLHQRSFREKVLHAYKNSCTLCRLAHPELLDAAHIIPDSDEGGEPLVSNGLSLCKIHHAAFDKNILGIDPDYCIHIRRDILEEIDGPMLKYGLQRLEGNTIILPRKPEHHPDRDRLDRRYREFREAG